jgi:carbonic anhydrase
MSFCTAINCMDGRTQLPVNEYLRQLLGVDYVDTITEPRPVRILADEPQSESAGSILKRVDISIHKHGSQCIALVAHHDCAGNPADEKTQRDQSQHAIQFLRDHYPSVQLLALWVDSTWSVSQIV